MSFRKLFKKLCVFGSVASLALGLFAGSAKAAAPATTAPGKVYGTLNADQGKFTLDPVMVKDGLTRLLPTLPLNSSIRTNGGTYSDCFLDVSGMGDNTNPRNVTVDPYSWDTTNSKYVKGTLNPAARNINVYVRAQKQALGQEDTSSTNTGWFRVAGQNNDGSFYNIANSNNSGEGANNFKPAANVDAIGRWEIYYFIDGGDTYVDTDQWGNDW